MAEFDIMTGLKTIMSNQCIIMEALNHRKIGCTTEGERIKTVLYDRAHRTRQLLYPVKQGE